jgi:hypothetical protein
VVPFNFGGPQPEHRYPLPADAETSFNYAGSGSWESTRNLRDSAAKGFLPWVIVASVAPRKLIHAHEFSWDRERDPVWKRYQKVFGFYDAIDNLSFTHGGGVIHNNDPNGTHCTNIGAVHRKGIYAALKKWYDIPPPAKEPNERRSADELRCWTPEALAELKPKPLHEVLAKMAERHGKHEQFDPVLSAWERQKEACRVPLFDLSGTSSAEEGPPVSSCVTTWIGRRNWPGVWFKTLLMQPKAGDETGKVPLVWCIGQDGIHPFLKQRGLAVATFLKLGIAVAISDVSGTGSERLGDGRSRGSSASAYSSTTQIIGHTLLGYRLSDSDIGLGFAPRSRGFVVWGESLSQPLLVNDVVDVPYDLAQPRSAEPMGGIVASLLGLHFQPKAIIARGGLVSYRSVLDSPFVHVPHDALPINVFRAGDLPDVWAALAPKPLRLEGLVDGTNRRVTGERLEKALKPVSEAYKKGGLVVKEEYSSDEEIAKWIIEQLKK